MRRIRSTLLLTMLLAAGTLCACSDQRVTVGAPHELGKAWIVEGGDFHGDSFRDSLLNCAGCHEDGAFCTQCHFDPNQPDVRVPPGSGWTHRAPPPSHGFLPQYEGICNQCHNLLRGFGAGPASCHDCHGSPSPHPDGWVNPANPNFHGPSAQADLDSCRACHGADLTGGSTGVSCFGCHFDPDGSKRPAHVDPNVWSHDSGKAKIRHAAKDLFTTEEQVVCTTCHGLMKGFTTKPALTDCSTATCHPGFTYHGPDASFFAQHPDQAQADISSCQPCHDAPSPPRPAPYVPNFDGYVTGIACRSCHDQGIAHPPGPAGAQDWYLGHRGSGNRDRACSICHDVTQGRTPPLGTAPSCFSASFDSQICHPSGPGSAPHPTDGSYLDPTKHGPDAKGDPGMISCQACHAAPPSGRTPAPRFNLAIGDRIPKGCETCHAANTAHPSTASGDLGRRHWYGSFFTHKDATNLENSCGLCHGAGLEGDVGPACAACHTAGSPLTSAGCASCHVSPPSGQPTDTAPNRQGAHETHNELPEVAGICDACHSGGGTGTAAHFNDQRSPVLSISSAPGGYNAQTGGPPKFNAGNNNDGTCSGVSCHGGQTTPNWLTGSIDVDLDCTKCHVAETTRTQYNSAVSGEHDIHVNLLKRACTDCHNAETLQPGSTHFSHLKTTALEGPASATIGGGTTLLNAYDPTTQTCSPRSGVGCHASRPWAGD